MTSIPKKEITIENIKSIDFDLRNFSVSKKSWFTDSLWDFSDEDDVRLNTYTDAKLKIDWSIYTFDPYEYQNSDAEKIIKTHHDVRISRFLVEEVKIICFLQLEVPNALRTRGRKITRSKPTSITLTARTLVTLLATIDKIRFQRIKSLSPKITYKPLTSFSEISLQDLEDGILNYPFSDGDTLKKSLRYLCNPLLKEEKFNIKIEWTTNDLNNFSFPKTQARETEKVMPDELFRLLSDSASSDVAFFTESLKIKREDQITPFSHPKELPKNIYLLQAWEDYIEIRLTDQEYSKKLGKKSTNTLTQRKYFYKNYGIRPSKFIGYINKVQQACLVIIGLYTGGRYSDIASFSNECIKIMHGMHMLVGTQVKNQNLKKPIDNDFWPAIPIMVDAVNCLYEISRINNSEYLISSSYSSVDDSKKKTAFHNCFQKSFK